MVVKLSLMIVYNDDAEATHRRFMAMEREDLRHRSDVERLMNSLVPRGWGRSRWDRKPRSVPKPPPLKLCSFCDELKLKPEFSGQNWAKDEAAGCRCCMVRRVDDQKSLKAARVSDFKATFVYPAPLTAAAAIAEQAVSPVGDFPDTEHPPTPTGIPTLTPAQGSKCGPRSCSGHERQKPKAPRRFKLVLDSRSRRSTKTEKENLKKEKEDPKKHQQSGPVMLLPTPLPTESTAAAEQPETEAELATEQREMCWRKCHLTYRGDERWPGGGSTDSADSD